MTRDELIAFEADIAAEFNAGHIRAPVHLDGGNEDQLIAIFSGSGIRPTDWVFCSWRSHYKALLHGVPPAEVKAEIMAGRSITMCFPEHRFLSSAIVGGILPIAMGVALSIQRRGGVERVWCFIGDMTAATGIAHECAAYKSGHKLPLTIVVEENGLSVTTETDLVWKGSQRDALGYVADIRFDYELPWPHSGAGKRVEF